MSNPRKTKSTSRASRVYPFTAIVGQDEMKLALVLSVIDPLLGGVLIMGHRGTGKSTAVRALAELLPQISVVRDCVYRCDPHDEEKLCVACRNALANGNRLVATKRQVEVTELPLGATEDRVCGSIDIERALKDATKSFEPGLLARANRGFLYIDEVNLLEDHLVDLLLDVAVTGCNRVERESISIEHPANFVLIGSGNPEEGDLRPQLLDRFGLQVEVVTENDLELRAEIVERRELFESDREQFISNYQQEQQTLRKKIARARSIFASVKIERSLLRKIAELCTELKLDGHRGEITTARASRALAALSNRRKVADADVRQVATICLRHRLRREPFEEIAGRERIRQALDKVFGPREGRGSSDDDNHSGNGRPASRRAPAAGEEREGSAAQSAGPSGAKSGPQEADALPRSIRRLESDPQFSFKRPFGDRSSGAGNRHRQTWTKQKLNYRRGRYASSGRHVAPDRKVALDATLRAMAGLGPRDSVGFPTEALRFKQFKAKQGSLFILVIDTSGSMASGRIQRAQEIACALLKKSYLDRDSVAIVTFRGEQAEVALTPSRSMLRAKRALECLTVGGATPLSAGIVRATQVARLAKLQHGKAVLLVFTDGQANVALRSTQKSSRERRKEVIGAELKELGEELKRTDLPVIVIETQNRFLSRGGARRVAHQLGAQHVQMGFAPSAERS